MTKKKKEKKKKKKNSHIKVWNLDAGIYVLDVNITGYLGWKQKIGSNDFIGVFTSWHDLFHLVSIN